MKQIFETKDMEIRQHVNDTWKKSEERGGSFSRRMPVMLHSIDDNGRLLDVSDRWLEMFGYKREEVIGRKSVEFLTEESRRYAESVALPEFMKTGYVRDLPYQFLKKNNKIVDVSLSAIVERDENGNYSRSIAILTDITSLKKSEESLKFALDELEKLKNLIQAENVYLRQEIEAEHKFEYIVSKSKAMKQVLRKVEQVAPTDATVLILGETGTGKELLARAVHSISSRKERRLVKVDCSLLPPNLIESELFGHERGAFTSAYSEKKGRFELANNGTIFLDEISELPLALQSKLLRVLQDGEFERLGSLTTLKLDVRIIAASNRDLKEMVEKGEFRNDLYYRLNVIPILMPPLRDHKEDIPLLVNHFIKKYGAKYGKNIKTMPKSLMKRLHEFDWPGNVRELENIIERALITGSGKQLELGNRHTSNYIPSTSSNLSSLADVEVEHITKILERTNWRVSGKDGAAKILGLIPTTLEARMKKLGIVRKR